ncbi:MAG: imidazole glycerol phosphate synthase subunit HisH [Gammaproteobacteria bacterium]|nr:imidazole glycerol phosphate synthase subunit HisH [Gammaproteobacteria bacterium]MBT4655187.1 imidazole glycerol phosphate synthase subunit HisH [Gammaproteobacteria bacterium]MBT5116970.1 imidazole glycerol phosphate synthase subunit HisH [Gammaproteobacteria bacterium]MBT7932228.1 imidazole glycerol phosphate synthase subunit HisH [Gammaproteobacteria bacterium]MDG2159034.1 imidazole glycerol phosphate synthase subunit HisH [Gammaproteobacteria bacterium]
MADIAIIDYGMGNVHSVFKALKKVIDKNSKVKVTNSIKDILNCTHIVFPGQGAAAECMSNIKNNLDIVEFKKIIAQKPFLGICMGLQVLMTHSDENDGAECLNILGGDVLSLKNKVKSSIKVPHMGWNKIDQKYRHPLWANIPNNSFFYFVHSYYVQPINNENILSTTTYGTTFASGLFRDNIVAVQFHPEKSSKIGLKMLENFILWDGEVQ